MTRPKLEVVRPDDEHVELYIDGKYVLGASYDMHGSVGMEAIQAAARHVARALGADVVPVAEPSAQPWRYYVTFMVAVKRGGDGFDYMPAVRWVDLPGPIEGPEDTDRLCAEVAGKIYSVENVRITNFIYIDGPS